MPMIWPVPMESLNLTLSYSHVKTLHLSEQVKVDDVLTYENFTFVSILMGLIAKHYNIKNSLRVSCV